MPLSALLVAFGGVALLALDQQTNPQTATPAPASAPWFTATQVAEKVWRISDRGVDNVYLVEGQEKALLIDTGIGVADLARFAATLTSLPLQVINTHGHPDHTGSSFQFEKVLAHPSDFELIRRFSTAEMHANVARGMTQGTLPADSVEYRDVGDKNLAAIAGGQVLDLGRRRIEVVETPGHTRGSVCLLDLENRLLFTGDNDNTLVWLFLADCAPLEIYLQSLEKLAGRKKEFDRILPGHGAPLDTEFLGEQIACARSILDGSCAGAPYQSFAGSGLLCTYKRAGIAYNPDNLRVKE
jgi:glyoxylase-like metal-dependent hydrolase (beta-lactamase superfamily II)